MSAKSDLQPQLEKWDLLVGEFYAYLLTEYEKTPSLHMRGWISREFLQEGGCPYDLAEYVVDRIHEWEDLILGCGRVLSA